MRSSLVLLAACAGFRAYTPPAPLVSPGPAAEQGAACVAPDQKLVDFEEARQRAALDADLRAHGSMLLPAKLIEDDPTAHPLGTVFRGPAGERWLVVDEIDTCFPVVPPVGIDAAHEVFVIRPVPRPQTKRVVQLCQPICGGCGMPRPRAPVVVEIPEGSHLVPERDLTYPIAVQVDLKADTGHCEPPP